MRRTPKLGITYAHLRREMREKREKQCYVFLLYETADRRPDEPTRALMKKGMDLCVEWFKSKELYTEEMEQSVNGLYETVINRE